MDHRIMTRRFLQCVLPLGAGAWTLGRWGAETVCAAPAASGPIVYA
ncbi:MAG: hypothetical protein AB1505_12980 [Candidatus Latescibacterota bacterium]